jgi:hypothetical protein
MHDKTKEKAATDWWERAKAWNARDFDRWLELDGWPKDREMFDEWTAKYPWYWDFDGGPPDADYHRPEFTEPATCHQIYETVSEGTPVSPVFETKGEMAAWLVEQGHSEDAAARFCEVGWVPSGMACGGVYASNIQTLEPSFRGPCKGDADGK